MRTSLRLSSATIACALVSGCSNVDRQAADSGATSGPGASSAVSGASSGGEISTAGVGGSTAGAGGSTTGAGGSTTGAGGLGGAGGAGQGGVGGSAASTGGSGTGGATFDGDGDGWAPADGDCCDSIADCNEPVLVNPGAMELLGNGIDDDCDPNTDDVTPPPDCGGLPLATPTSSIELVKAMDICQFTTANEPLPTKKWGVINAAALLADGLASAPKDIQGGVLSGYGPNVSPKKHATLAAISSGTARALGDPGGISAQVGYDTGTQVGVPAGWLAAHGGVLPAPSACPNPCNGVDCATAYDSFDLKVTIRVPTNTPSFSYDFKFYTAEFPEYVCQSPSDLFVALLGSQEPSIPADHNIAVDPVGDAISVNNGFLKVCFPPPNSPPGTCPYGTTELVGTGMGGANANLDDGGGTAWLTNDAPVVPGEIIELELILWDAGGHGVDSLVLLDNFRFKTTPAVVAVYE